MIKKESNGGIGHSLVELGGVRHIFARAAPPNGGGLHEQVRDGLRSVQSVFRKHGAGSSIIKQSIFISAPGQLEECRQIVKDFYGRDLRGEVDTYQAFETWCGVHGGSVAWAE